MLDPTRMEEVLRRGGAVAAAVAAWRELDTRRRTLQAELDGRRAERNAANDSMAKLDKKSAEFAAARDRLRELSTAIKAGEAELATVEADCELQLLALPNAPHPSVPTGSSEHDNPVLHA